jgi:hypothetical protein
MSQMPLQRQTSVSIFFRALVVSTALVFLFAATYHTGVIDGSQLVPALIVEGLCGIGFAVCSYAVLAGARWARTMVNVVYIYSSVGVALGITALSRSPGLRTPMNVYLHATMVVLLLVGIALLMLPGPRKALKGDRVL